MVGPVEQAPGSRRRTERRRSRVAAVVVAVLATACAAGGADLDERATQLADGESLASISPSGRYLLTVNDEVEVVADELVADLCVRSGERYDVVECTSVPAGAVWSASWNPAEDRVAFTHAGAQRAGERNDAIYVLDVTDMRSRAVTPTDAWLPATPHAAWTPGGQLVVVQPDARGHYPVHTDAGPAAPDSGLPASIEGVEIVGLDADEQGLVVTGTVVAGTTDAGVTTTHRWTASGPDPTPLLPAVAVTHDTLATDPIRGRVITRLFDVHASPAPEIRELRGGAAAIEPAGGETVWAVDFAPDGRRLAALILGEDAASVAVYRIDDHLVLVEESVTPIADIPDRRSFQMFSWTGRGVVVEGRTDEQSGRIFELTLE